jgi:hypothetical protein
MIADEQIFSCECGKIIELKDDGGKCKQAISEINVLYMFGEN